ncbi:hypothetical protein EV182_007614 [Spiromyces aspiralis]|uniref:Uncharacterized protein n=1 Tax=Spiromyces aspiralis TaxID=68401 RepID=A0ACC1HM20_9FUNG|nr:hypothetical protein EV182_007614 [Spiromyces aspiralis]
MIGGEQEGQMRYELAMMSKLQPSGIEGKIGGAVSWDRYSPAQRSSMPGSESIDSNGGGSVLTGPSSEPATLSKEHKMAMLENFDMEGEMLRIGLPACTE